MVIAGMLAIVSIGALSGVDDEPEAEDCSAHPQTPDAFRSEAEEADCKGENEKAISEEENRP